MTDVKRSLLGINVEMASMNQYADFEVTCDGTEVPLTLVAETRYEAALRSGIKRILNETTEGDEDLVCIREICLETLSRMDRLTAAKRMAHRQICKNCTLDIVDNDAEVINEKSGTTSVFTKSPQEYPRVANKPPQTSYNSPPTGESPRWKVIDGNEDPLMDLIVMFRGDSLPEGFTKLGQSTSGQRADLNKGSRGPPIYLCQSKDLSSGKAPISDITVIFPERGEFIPNDYEVIRRRGVPANVNMGTQGEKIYLCFKRSAESAITDLVVMFPRKNDTLPYGYMKVDRSTFGHVADLNMNSGGTEVFLGYKKKVANLRAIHKKWLYATVTASQAHTPVRLKLQTPSTPGKLKQLRSAFFLKAAEVREQELSTASSSLLPLAAPSTSPLQSPRHSDWNETIEYYMFPLLLACYTRQGSVAEAAVIGLTHCLDEGVFSCPGSELCGLEVVINAVSSVCYQGIRDRFESTLCFFRKAAQKFTEGYPPLVLHTLLEAFTFIGYYDASLAKCDEDGLISKIMSAYEDTLVSSDNKKKQLGPDQPSNILAYELVAELIDEISTGAELATMLNTMLGVSKSHSSIESVSFCRDITSAINHFVKHVAERNVVQLVVTYSKAVNRKVVSLGDLATESDQGTSVSSLRALNQILLTAGPLARQQQVFGQVVRRAVLLTINAAVLTWVPEVFRDNLMLVSTLWNHYRRYLKVEFALLFEHVFLRILRATAPCTRTHQLEIMHEMTTWLQLPHNVVEIFLNFDLDRFQQWKIFEHLCSTLGSIGEGSIGHIINEERDDLALELQNKAIDAILAMARSVMDASGHAHLISCDRRTRRLSMYTGGWEQDDSSDDVSPRKESLMSFDGDTGTAEDTQSGLSLTKKQFRQKRSTSRNFGTVSVRMRNELQIHNQQLLKRAMEISASKSLKKALEYLVAMNFIKDTPRNITSFLRIYHDFFDETEIGDYLGEGDEDNKVHIRLAYVRAISFKGLTLVESLRHFLTNGGFRLPGEAQKIERLVEAFAQCYWDDSSAAFSSTDTAMILAYSIIMLNTDLHNPQVKKNKMSKEQFVRNNRGIDNGKDLPKRFLEGIYDDIANNPMHIKGSRITSHASRENGFSVADLENERFFGGIAKAVAQSEELMKDLSHTYNTFQFVGVDTPISPDLIKILFERVWFSLLTLSTTILCDSQSDLSARMQCLDLLRYCISTCLFLNMTVERQAFCGLLRKVQNSLDGTSHDSTSKDTSEDTTYEWMQAIETAGASADPWKVMGDVHLLVNDLKETIQIRQKVEKLDSVIQRIHRAHMYLKNSTTYIYEGDLTKKCRSRNQLYRFFLFNDQLMYADKSMTGKWSPHNSLRLKLTRISNIPENNLSKHAFHIRNPIKSVIVFAESEALKIEWMRRIDDAIADASKTLNRRALTHSSDTFRSSHLVTLSAKKMFLRLGSPMSSPTSGETRQFSFDSEDDLPENHAEAGVTLSSFPDLSVAKKNEMMIDTDFQIKALNSGVSGNNSA
ncbi:putative Sec7 domain, pleckstrin domain, PH-like domain superfamily, MABP domain-containing protein [Plasmopara halstedii]